MTSNPTTKQSWKRPILVVVAVAILGAVAVGTSLVMDEGSGIEPITSAEGVYERVAAALEEAEPAGFANVTHGSGVVLPSLMGWQINMLRLDPVFSNCIGTNVVTCDLTYGEDYFYSVVLGSNVEGSITVEIAADETFRITQWPFPEDVKQVEYDLRAWVQATHPELETRMFGNDAYGVFKFTEEALRLHADHLEEYMVYLGA
ncbi:MAG: hypothetical protein HKN95_08590 [Acidimicrobiia bacterium]|nr:hypothetical protein [Acidimicrobiia bacterium]